MKECEWARECKLRKNCVHVFITAGKTEGVFHNILGRPLWKKNQPHVLLTTLWILANKHAYSSSDFHYPRPSPIYPMPLPHLSFLFTETICATTHFRLPIERRNNIIHATKNYLVPAMCRGWEENRKSAGRDSGLWALQWIQALKIYRHERSHTVPIGLPKRRHMLAQNRNCSRGQESLASGRGTDGEIWWALRN